jgi:hypothetical protein
MHYLGPNFRPEEALKIINAHKSEAEVRRLRLLANLLVGASRRKRRGTRKQNKQKPTEGRKLVLKQKIEGAAIKNRKGSSWVASLHNSVARMFELSDAGSMSG